MQKLPLPFLAFAVVAFSLAQFPCGETTDEVLTDVSGSTKNESKEIGAEVPENLFVRNSGNVTKSLSSLKLYKRLRTWNDARRFCHLDGGQLVVINSAEKQAVIRSWLNTESLEAIWVGFHDLFEQGSWTTVNDKSIDELDYYPWARGEPNNQYFRQHCGVIWRTIATDGVDDYMCDGNFAFVCENKSC